MPRRNLTTLKTSSVFAPVQAEAGSSEADSSEADSPVNGDTGNRATPLSPASVGKSNTSPAGRPMKSPVRGSGMESLSLNGEPRSFWDWAHTCAPAGIGHGRSREIANHPKVDFRNSGSTENLKKGETRLSTDQQNELKAYVWGQMKRRVLQVNSDRAPDGTHFNETWATFHQLVLAISHADRGSILSDGSDQPTPALHTALTNIFSDTSPDHLTGAFRDIFDQMLEHTRSELVMALALEDKLLHVSQDGPPISYLKDPNFYFPLNKLKKTDGTQVHPVVQSKSKPMGPGTQRRWCWYEYEDAFLLFQYEVKQAQLSDDSICVGCVTRGTLKESKLEDLLIKNQGSKEIFDLNEMAGTAGWSVFCNTAGSSDIMGPGENANSLGESVSWSSKHVKHNVRRHLFELLQKLHGPCGESEQSSHSAVKAVVDRSASFTIVCCDAREEHPHSILASLLLWAGLSEQERQTLKDQQVSLSDWLKVLLENQKITRMMPLNDITGNMYPAQDKHALLLSVLQIKLASLHPNTLASQRPFFKNLGSIVKKAATLDSNSMSNQERQACCDFHKGLLALLTAPDSQSFEKSITHYQDCLGVRLVQQQDTQKVASDFITQATCDSLRNKIATRSQPGDPLALTPREKLLFAYAMRLVTSHGASSYVYPRSPAASGACFDEKSSTRSASAPTLPLSLFPSPTAPESDLSGEHRELFNQTFP